jgi:hypothetical protein
VVLGVDHFNWVQQVTSIPDNWEPQTLVDLDYSRLGGIEVDAGGIFRYRDGSPIVSRNVHLPFYDPVVLFSSTDDPIRAFTRAFIVRHPDININRPIIWVNGPGGAGYLDDLAFYWTDQELTDPQNVTPTQLLFNDTPAQPSSAEPFTAGHPFLEFETRLAGVGYDGSSFRVWQGEGYRTNFDWKSNTIQLSDGSFLGGSQFIGGWGASSRGAPQPPFVGGIFDVRFDDGTSVPGIPTDPPPFPSLVTPQSVIVAGGKPRRPATESITIDFSGPVTLDPGAFELVNQRGRKTHPIGLTVTDSLVGGRTVAVLHFAGRRRGLADGKYTLTIRADKILDRLGRPLDGDANGEAGGDLVKALRIVRGRSK